MHKTSAWPLALIYLGLICYASLYPFTGWRDQGIMPWTFITSPLSPYWTGFDVGINILGYMPFGFLLVLIALRTGHARYGLIFAPLAAGILSLAMESLQSYLPLRVSSNLDLGLNILGAGLGALLAWAMKKIGGLEHWSRFRARWFVTEARGGLVLLAMWPLALLFPATVPFGLGQVFERFEDVLPDALAGTPFLDWLPTQTIKLQPLVPDVELICVALGVLIPCLLGFCIIRSITRRTLFLILVFVLGISVTALSSALSYGPEHAWAWFSLPTKAGLVVALGLGISMLWVPQRASAALVLLALGIYLGLLNQVSANPYFAQTLATWEQGRFIRFHGLAQWLGWLWPYAVLVYVLMQVSSRKPKN